MRSQKQYRGRGPRKQNQGGIKPPQIASNIVIDHVYRFVSTSGASTQITQANLLGIAGGVGTVANTTISLIANAVSVKKVSIWSPPSAQGQAVTCSLEWTSLNGGRMIEVSDSSLSVAVPAVVVSRPPKGSLASLWLGNTADGVFVITAPTGSIIDVHAVHVLEDAAGANITYAAAAVTLGDTYWLPLDGTTDLYTPVSLRTTT